MEIQMDKQCFCCNKQIADKEVFVDKDKTIEICSGCLNNSLSNGCVVEAFDDNGFGQRHVFIRKNNALYTYDGTMCLSARYASKFNYLTCPQCGKLHSDRETKYGLCPKCSEKSGYIRCNKCGKWKHNSEMMINSRFCKNCVETDNELLVNSYHSSHESDYRFVGFKGDVKNFIGLGFELEIDSFGEIDKKQFKADICSIVKKHNALSVLFIENDRSLLNGVELISQPHTITEMRRFINGKMDMILRELREQTNAEDCSPLASLHVHISRNVFGKNIEQQKINIAKLQYWVSRNVELLMRIGRRKTFKKCEFPKAPLSISEAMDLTEDPETRYLAINVCNENTIEFRFMKTTTYTHILRALVDFCWQISTQICLLDWQDLESDKLLSCLSGNVLEYFQYIGLNLKSKGGN